MLLGPSTELELALFTLCYKARPGKRCHVSLGDLRTEILTRVDENGELSDAHFVFA